MKWRIIIMRRKKISSHPSRQKDLDQLAVVKKTPAYIAITTDATSSHYLAYLFLLSWITIVMTDKKKHLMINIKFKPTIKLDLSPKCLTYVPSSIRSWVTARVRWSCVSLMAAADLTSLFNSSRIKSRSFRTLRLERHPGSSSILNSCWSIANPFPSCPRSRWQVPNCTMRYFLLLFFRSLMAVRY